MSVSFSVPIGLIATHLHTILHSTNIENVNTTEYVVKPIEEEKILKKIARHFPKVGVAE